MDEFNESEWQVDRRRSLVTHCDGFSAEMAMGQVRNILNVPPGITSRELTRLCNAARKAWSASLPDPDESGPSAIAARIGHGPRLRHGVKRTVADADEPPRPSAPIVSWQEPRQDEPPKPSPRITVKRRRLPRD